MPMENNLLSNTDCIKGIKKLDSESVDHIVTDPPYGLNKAGVTNDKDLSLFYEILPECYRVLKKDAFFITFFSTKLLPDLFKDNPFKYFWQIVLYCPNGAVGSSIGYTKYMSVFVFKKGNPKMNRYNKDIFLDTPGRMVEPEEGFINHPTPKPTKFIKEILEMFTKENDLILDPFMGSGSTGVACQDLNRRFIGFEINKDYYELTKRRLRLRKKKITDFS